jgi:hypothetical protein
MGVHRRPNLLTRYQILYAGAGASDRPARLIRRCETRAVGGTWRGIVPIAVVGAAIVALRFAAPFLAPRGGPHPDVAADRPTTDPSAPRADPRGAPISARTALDIPPAPCPGPPPRAPVDTRLRLRTGLHAPRFEPRCLAAPAHRALWLRLTNDLAGLRTRLAVYDVGSAGPSGASAPPGADRRTAVFVGRPVAASSSVDYRLPALHRGVYLLQGDTFPSLMRAFLVVAGPSSRRSR